MRKVVFVLAALILALGVFALPVRSVNAQEGTPTTVCDSTLLLLLYVAEHDYGFQSTSMDLTTVDKGQFAPWFDMMMTAEESADIGTGQATEEAMTTEATAEAADTSAATAMPMATTDPNITMTTLVPGVVAGEAAECTALRAELENFFFSQINNMMMGAEG